MANRISFSGSQDPNEFRARLREVTGLDQWSIEYIAMRALSDPDAFPANDRGPLMRRAEGWRPWRAYAAMYLWQGNSIQTNRLPRLHIDALSA
jgi:AraC family transcriptional regulator of adaptative response / DNA-3-methyladenine glycosylase II